MKIIVDLLWIIPGKNRGTQTYVDSLLPELTSLRGIEVLCLTNRSNHSHFDQRIEIDCLCAPLGGRGRLVRTLYQQILLSRAAKRLGGDILFCPGYLSPVLPSIPTVVTIHDMNFRDIPASVPAAVRLGYAAIVPRAAQAAQRVITVSEFSKQRIIKRLRLPAHKIAVVPEGPLRPHHIVEEGDWTSVRRKYSINREYFLSISQGAPHKNIRRLVEGFAQMKRDRADCYNLVLVGHGLDRDFMAYLEREGLQGDVICTGFVSESDKITLLRNALAYFFPSLYEGFGLPALEAQSVGVPLAASKFGSLPETCGAGALYFDAMSIESISKALTEIGENQRLRIDLVEAGYENVSRFSWKRAAVETLSVFSSALE